MTRGLRAALCKAYADKFANGELPSVRDQGGDHILGMMYRDLFSSFPQACALESVVSFLGQRAAKAPKQKPNEGNHADDGNIVVRGPFHLQIRRRFRIADLAGKLSHGLRGAPNHQAGAHHYQASVDMA